MFACIDNGGGRPITVGRALVMLSGGIPQSRRPASARHTVASGCQVLIVGVIVLFPRMVRARADLAHDNK